MIRVRETDDEDEVRSLDRECFEPGEAAPVELTGDPGMWLATDAGEAVGYAVAYVTGGVGYFDRYGVAETHRGAGLGRRLVRASLRWAREQGAFAVWTYTTPSNAESIRCLTACGFRAWRPAPSFFGFSADSTEARRMAGYCYWRREL